MRNFLLFGLLIVALTTGCEKRTIEEGEAEESKTDDAKEQVERPKPAERKSIEGNWVVDVGNYKSSSYHPAVLLKADKDEDGKIRLRLLEAMKPLGDPVLHRQSADADSIYFTLVVRHPNTGQPVAQIDVDLASNDGEWRGVAIGREVTPGRRLHPTSVEPARLYPTTEDSLEKFPPREPYPLAKKFNQAIESFAKKGNRSDLVSFVEENPTHPLSYSAIAGAIAVGGPLGPFPSINKSPEEVNAAELPTRKRLQSYLRLVNRVMPHWGPKAHRQARFTLTWKMFVFRHAPELALETIEKLQEEESASQRKRLSPDTLRQIAQALRIEVELKRALTSEDEQVRRDAAEQLRTLGSQQLWYHPMRLFALAEAARRSGDVDRALRRYGELLVLPGLAEALADDFRYRRQSPPDLQRRFDELWTSSGRPDDERPSFLEGVYRKAAFAYLKDFSPDAVSYEKRRKVLLEFFTGSESPRCAAADLAVAALQKTFDRADVLVLRYHLAVPKASPLCSAAAKDVARLFGSQRPPDLLVNGTPLEALQNGQRIPANLTGSLATYPGFYWPPNSREADRYRLSVPALYNSLRRTVVGYALQEPSGYRVTLDADRKKNVIAIRARVKAPDERADDVRLRFILAEDHIDYTGANKIRRHELVVRDMPGGVRGLKVDKKDGEFTMNVDLNDVRARLVRHLSELKGRADNKGDLAPAKLRNLHLVGIVQNHKTGQIYDVDSLVVLGNATRIEDRHAFGPTFAPRPLRHLREQAMRPDPPPLPLTPPKATKKK